MQRIAPTPLASWFSFIIVECSHLKVRRINDHIVADTVVKVFGISTWIRPLLIAYYTFLEIFWRYKTTTKVNIQKEKRH
eukprot:scaffold1171_cov177-Amphora_coffeaeformis.AAC.2